MLKQQSINKMKEIKIDFTEIADMEDFYAALKEEMNLPEHFGNNLDALFDFITGEAEMPLEIEFENLSVDQLEDFENLIDTLENAEDELEDFSFRYYLEQFDDGE